MASLTRNVFQSKTDGRADGWCGAADYDLLNSLSRTTRSCGSFMPFIRYSNSSLLFGEKGYMPMIGHVAEADLVAGYEFREGNAAPAARNLEFLQVCERNMPKGKKITAVRADSAAYQAAIFT